jgi:phospholipid-binding lipoprotein MlaA
MTLGAVEGVRAHRSAIVDEMYWMPRRVLHFLACIAVLTAAQIPTARAADDPFEAVNRRIYGFNRAVQAKVLGPLAERYLSATTPQVRRGVANALANLREPISAVSGLTAGRFGLAANALARFAINSTAGFAGVEDRATRMGYPPRAFSLADAACSWGVPSGPFLMLPLLGPSTLRDAGALVAQSVALDHTLGADAYLAWSGGDLFTGYAQLHRELQRTEAASLDPYAVYRSAYLQRRAQACPVDRPSASAEDEE